MRNAATLAQLAGEVFRAPLSDFLRVNPPLKADQRLSPGTEVRVPDRGFGPQLAARLSADVITREALSRAERVRLIRLLVPASASRRTTLDRVLARLVLAAHVEREMLGELQGLAESATRDYDLAVGQ
jgi:hypothetical protein